jgi:hypothetical protein
MEMAVRMPGDVSDVTGFTKDGRRAAWVLEGKTVSDALDRLFPRVAELRPRVKSGELTVDQARETIETEFADMSGTNDLSATCPLAAEDAAARAAFDEGLAKAREAWATSPWKSRIERARAEAAAKVQGGNEDNGGVR